MNRGGSIMSVFNSECRSQSVLILHFFQVYSNRAACYTKLGAMPEGLKDAEKCIELDPTFSKGYTRKGAVQFFMKESDKALETYKEGLKHDPNNQELLDGIKRCDILLHSCYLWVEYFDFPYAP